METWVVSITIASIVIGGGFYFLLPGIARRGLLFGVYVGEKSSVGEDARRITRSWYIGMSLWTGASIVTAVLLGGYFKSPGGAAAAAALLSIGFFAEYLRAYLRALKLAQGGAPPPPAAAHIGLEEPEALLLPYVAMALGLVAGLYGLGDAWSHYAELPDMMPTHFGLSGHPDAWKPRSFFTVMALPLMTLVLGVGLGGIALLTAKAKRAIRFQDHGVSFGAQQRFRRIMANFLAFVAMLTTGMLAVLTHSSLRVALKESDTISPVMMFLTLVLVIVALGGSIYIALRYGQGGSRLEQSAADAPLTNGLADNRFWYLGMFYVNRDDPSIIVERRFGFGYTINLGNPRALALILGFVGLMLVITVLSSLEN